MEIEVDGKVYTLTQEAYIDGIAGRECFRAMAICVSDHVDEDGWQPNYKVLWDLRDGFDLDQEEDMSDACDWFTPSSVERSGEYNATLDQYF